MTSRGDFDDAVRSWECWRDGEHVVVVLLGLVGHGSSDAMPELESGVRSNAPQPPTTPPVGITRPDITMHWDAVAAAAADNDADEK